VSGDEEEEDDDKRKRNVDERIGSARWRRPAITRRGESASGAAWQEKESAALGERSKWEGRGWRGR
jgi:hypothetical protein